MCLCIYVYVCVYIYAHTKYYELCDLCVVLLPAVTYVACIKVEGGTEGAGRSAEL